MQASRRLPDSVRELAEHAVDVALPLAVEQGQLAVGGGLPALGHLDEFVEEGGFILPARVAAGATLQAGPLQAGPPADMRQPLRLGLALTP